MLSWWIGDDELLRRKVLVRVLVEFSHTGFAAELHFFALVVFGDDRAHGTKFVSGHDAGFGFALRSGKGGAADATDNKEAEAGE